MANNSVTWVSVEYSHQLPLMLQDVEAHVKDISGKGWRLVSTETVSNGMRSSYVFFWERSA